ncbi:exo-alpha-sialidase [Acerihabitans sp.]|uniref:exo-alpha-sialidase n=1 Tax=Acerihabitans sp. TaxID=2811394 RepID=UPI002ED9C6B3
MGIRYYTGKTSDCGCFIKWDQRHWDAFVDISADQGGQWQSVAVPLEHIDAGDMSRDGFWRGLGQNALWENDLARVFQWDGVIQPTAWESRQGHIHLLMRSTRGRICRSDSIDNGRTWSPADATALPNNNSGIDLAHLGGGRLALVYNPIADHAPAAIVLSCY